MELFDLHNLVAHSVHTVQFTHQKFNKFPLVPRVLSVSKLLFLFDNQLILQQSLRVYVIGVKGGLRLHFLDIRSLNNSRFHIRIEWVEISLVIILRCILSFIISCLNHILSYQHTFLQFIQILVDLVINISDIERLILVILVTILNSAVKRLFFPNPRL